MAKLRGLGIGWVRGDLVPEESAVEEILALRKRIEEIQAELEATRTSGPEGTSELAQGDDTFDLNFSFVASPDQYSFHGTGYKHHVEAAWDEIFAAVAPLMINEVSDEQLSNALTGFSRDMSVPELRSMKDLKGKRLMDFSVNDDDFQTVKVQLRALGLISKSAKNRSVKDTNTYWTLTPYAILTT